MDFRSKLQLFFKYFLTHPGRIFNLALLKLSKQLKLPKILGRPLTAMIEPTNYCNLNCPLCPTGAGLINRKKENLSLADFKKILDNLGSSIVHLRLWNWGEPLLNKDFPEMIKYAKSKNMFVNTSTNSFFLNEKIMEKLINSGLDQLIVSLDGASEKTYNKYRKNGDFKSTVNALKKATELKSKRGTPYPEIKLQFIVMKHNEHEIKEVIKLAKQTGVDTLYFKTVGVMDPRLKNKIKKYLPKNKLFRRHMIEGSKIKNTPLAGKICDYLWTEITVNVDGSAVTCCRDAQGNYPFGNLKHQPLSKIWNSSKLVNFRKKVLKNKDSIDICRTCSGSNKEFSIQEINLK